MYDPTMAGIELPRARPYSPAVVDAGGSGQNWHGGQIALPNGKVAQTDTIKIVRVLGYSL